LKTDVMATKTTAPRTASTNLQTLGVILTSVAVGAVGQLILKAAVNSMGKLELSLSTLVGLATNPLLLLAMGLYGVSAVLWLLALMRAELSFVYPFLSLTFMAVLVGSAALFNERVSVLRVAGFLIIISGLIIIARGERDKV